MSMIVRNKEYLTDLEKQSIKVLNSVTKYDGFLTEEDSVYILEHEMKKFIPKKRHHLIYINREAYPVKISIRR